MPSNESKIPVGQVLVGKYRVVREIGRGGMAAVYEAEQLSLGKKVAIKVLAAELAASTIVIERFFREARAAASVKSPYIVDVYDSGRLDDGRPFIAMEMLEGESLYDRMARVRIIDVETTVRVIVHTAKGLMKAHAAGIVHRDLKPENIFLTKGEDGEDVCKILDFGLAKFYAPVNPEEKAQKRLTREGAVFGTPAYMSPEQVKGQGNVDHRADLWALGCMAFECLIGRPVWNMDQGVAMTFAAIATGPIPVPSAIRSDLPPAFDAWFKKCLERDPAKRYQSAKELADACVEVWGQGRGQGSSHSFPSFTSTTGPGAPAGGGGLQELALDADAKPLPPPAPTTGRGGKFPSPANGNGAMRGSLASDSSAIPLLQRASGDVPPASQPTIAPKPASPVRLAVSAVFLAGSLSAAIFVWVRFTSPQVFSPIVQSTASAPASAAPTGSGPSSLPVEEPKWVSLIGEGQKNFTKDAALAGKKFQDAIAVGGQGAVAGKVFLEQLRIATNPKDASGPCKTMSLSRPRTSWERKGERPAILTTPKGALVVWVDDHEQAGKDHVYGVMTDETGKSSGPVRDLTPEASDAQRPQLISQSTDRSVLLWWDTKGREAGIRARFLDPDGRIDTMKGQSVLVGAARPGEFWPSIEKGREGFIVAWQDDRGKEKEYDIFVRRLTSELDTAGPETRLTDYHARKGTSPRVRYPSLAIAPSTLLVAYRLDGSKPNDRDVMRLRLPLDELEKSEKTAGLPESKDAGRDTRVLGNDVVRINKDKESGDAPAIACGKEGCFAVWQSEPTGASYAFIDPNVGKVQWSKKFSEKGAHPSIAVNGDGQVAVAYYENNRIKIAFLSRDGVIGTSSLLRIHDMTAPRPTLAAGAEKNEWLLAWQDTDVPKGTNTEVYASRVSCK